MWVEVELIGEACHFVDLARYLVGSKIKNKNVYYSSDAVNGTEISDQAFYITEIRRRIRC